MNRLPSLSGSPFSDAIIPHELVPGTISGLGERELLARIVGRFPPSRSDVRVGIGDDAAVVTVGRNEQVVLTTDALVEGVHFRRDWSTAADIGHKALAVNLSDLAAMGAQPAWTLLSLLLPAGVAVGEIEELVSGYAALASVHQVAVIGGNITRTNGPLIVDVTAVGTAKPRRILTRSGARAGDQLYVSGALGSAAAGMEMLMHGPPPTKAIGVIAEPGTAGVCIGRHRRPDPRVRLGLAVARTRAARAAMDLSDGLADAVRQIARASGCGAIVDVAALPIEPAAREWWTARGEDPVRAALSGGDDYELLLAVPPRWHGRLRAARQRVSAPALTHIGVLTPQADELCLERHGVREPLPSGYEHFSC